MEKVGKKKLISLIFLQKHSILRAQSLEIYYNIRFGSV